MNNFVRINPGDIDGNPFTLIGDKWMLVTAADGSGSFNTMTASWGGVGILWGKPVAFVFVRPQRYTDEFIKKSDRLTLSFFGEEWRKALAFCGSHSGRDCDKIKETGLLPVSDNGYVWFDSAKLVLKCRKLYADVLRPESFVSPEPLENYANGDFHNVYVCEITEASVAKQ